ncbi:MAG: DUF393 domain-containing protein [Crocinitomicaceae bacterium]|nr:DUF393 domain-containing protein [Crocinitomicaceae bacterium]
MIKSNDLIVFYDGDCGFCNRTVAFVLKYDKTKRIQFAAIQTEFTQALFKAKNLPSPDLSTFYFLENENVYQKSTAALRLAKHLKFPRSFLRFFWIVPRFIRDGVYDFIAKRRQRLSNGYCVIPSKEDRERFLEFSR